MPRWGLTLPFAGVPLSATEPLVRRAEAAGWDDLWTGDTNGPDGFTPLALATGWTERMRLGTGVVGAFTRGPAVLAQHAAALADASGGRFVLGIGSSSDVIVERWNGVPFERPLTKVRETVAALRPVLAGERGPGGFKLETPPPHPVPIYVAALRDRMLALGGAVGDGTFLTSCRSRPSSTSSATIAPRDGHDVVCRFFCIPQPADEGLGARALPVRRLRDRAGLRGVLPRARLGRRDRPDGARLARRRPQAGGRARARGAVARGLRLRPPAGDARAARAVRRGRDHVALPAAVLRAGAAAGADRRLRGPA